MKYKIGIFGSDVIELAKPIVNNKLIEITGAMWNPYLAQDIKKHENEL